MPDYLQPGDAGAYRGGGGGYTYTSTGQQSQAQ